MADISSYPLGSPRLADLIIGSETYDAAVNPPVYGNPTRNFTVSSINALAPQGTVTSIGIAADNGAGTTITVAGTHSFLGTANQISTSVAGTVVTFAFPTDVVVPRDFTVTRQLNVGGESSLTGTLNMNAAKIANLQNPTLAQDAATKAYVDGASGVGGTAGTIPIFDATGLGDSLITFTANMFTVASTAKFKTGWLRLSDAGETTGVLEAKGSLGTLGQVLSSGADQLTEWKTLDLSFLPLAGGTVTGQINGITPVAAANLTRKDYVDTAVANLSAASLPLAGGTMTGQINGITPTAAANLTRKDYVDASLGYKTYAALLTQTGTDAPVATVLKNDTGATMTWTRSAVGQFNISSGAANVFVVNKTAVAPWNLGDPVSNFVTRKRWNRVDDNNVAIDNQTDGVFLNGFIEIRIYA